MTDKKKNGWIKFVPSLDLPKERVSIAYDTHDERGVRYAYGYFQFYNGTCVYFWKDGNEQPKVIKAEDIKYWMPIPSLDVQEEPKPKFRKGNKVIYLNEEYVVEDITDHYILRSTREMTSVPVVHVGFGNEDYELRLVEEPVSEDLDEAAKADAMIERPDDTEVGYDLNRYGGFISGAQWREEQMMKGAKLYGWIARDEDGTLHIFEDEPMRIKEEGRWWDRDYMSKPIEHGDFPDLKWEDEPIYVRLLIVKSE